MNNPQPNGPAAALHRIRLIAGHTLGEALHLRLTLFLGLTGAALIGGALELRAFNFGAAELKFLGDFGLGALGFFATLLAVLATAHLFFSEIESRAVCTVLTRPVRRGEYLGGRFTGVAALLALFVAGLALVLAVLLAGRGVQLHARSVPLPLFLQAGALVWLKATLVAAMTLLVCAYAGSALFASCTGLLLALIAHLQPVAHASGGLAWLRVWPNLGLFDAGALLAAGQSPPGIWLLGVTAYWAAYVLLFGAAAAYVFQRREF